MFHGYFELKLCIIIFEQHIIKKGDIIARFETKKAIMKTNKRGKRHF